VKIDKTMNKRIVSMRKELRRVKGQVRTGEKGALLSLSSVSPDSHWCVG